MGFEMKKPDVLKCFQEVDKETTQNLTFSDFLKIVTPRLNAKDSKEEIYKVFKLFDEDNTGKISFKNLKKISAEVGESLSDDELHEMIAEADT